MTTLFHSYQEKTGRRPPLKLITPSPTRWNGYHAALLRFLKIEPIFEEWLAQDERLDEEDRARLKWKNLDEREMDIVRALTYVLFPVKSHALILEDAKAASGVITLRVVENLVYTLRLMA